MKENEDIKLLLLANGFLFDENEETWIKDEWNVRIIDNEIEIYEIDGRYLHTPLDYNILVNILEQI